MHKSAFGDALGRTEAMSRNTMSGSVAHACILFVLIGLVLSGLTLLAIGAVIVAVLGAAIYASLCYWQYLQDKRRIEDAERDAVLERERLIGLTQKQFPHPDDWLSGFYDELFPLGTGHLPKDLVKALLEAAHSLYCLELPQPPETDTAEALTFAAQHAESFDPEFLKATVASSFNSLLAKLPAFSQMQFTVPLAELIDLPSAIYDLITPFRDERLYEKSFVYYTTWLRFQENAVKAGGGKEPVYPQDFKSELPNHKIAHLYLRNTAFDEIVQTQVPFGFDDETRCTHHWCMGPYGAGKTTYLRHYIKADLGRVQRNECSLVIIDSKKLIREMRSLSQFNSTLKDRVMIVDPEHPVALNPFYLPRRQTHEAFQYMLANLKEATGLQEDMLPFLVDAAAVYPEPSLYTIRDFFALKRGELPPHFEQMDGDTQFWFRHTFDTIHPNTKNGLHQRIVNFMKKNPTLSAMLNADRCALDLFDWLHPGGRVLLVDTDNDTLGDEGTNIVGRLFIALIDQVSARRTKLNEKALKPIFCYLDEAQDYIKEDEKFAKILEKARAQKIAVTVSHHHTGQLDNRIEQSLWQAGIISECTLPEKPVTAKTRRRTYCIPLQRLDFAHADHMSPSAYEAMRSRMNERFGSTRQPTQSEPSDLPEIDDPVTGNYSV